MTNQDPLEEFDAELLENYKQLVNELFEEARQRSASTVSETVDALTQGNSIVVAVNQTIREPSVTLDPLLMNISEELKDGLKSIPTYIVNLPMVEAMVNACQSARNQWGAVCAGKLKQGKKARNITDANKIGIALNMDGYIVTKSAIPYGMYNWKKYEDIFFDTVEGYVETYPEHYAETKKKLINAYKHAILKQWYDLADRNPTFKDAVTRKSFETSEEAENYLNKMRLKYAQLENIPLKENFRYSISSEKIKEDKKVKEIFIVQTINLLRPTYNYHVTNFDVTLNELVNEAIAQIPSPDNPDYVRSLFNLKMSFDRIPSTEEMETARNKRLEAEWSTGIKHFAQKAKIKSTVETMYDVQQQVIQESKNIWSTIVLNNLNDALKDTLIKIKKGKQDIVKMTSLQTLLGKHGKIPKMGVLDVIIDMSQNMETGSEEILLLADELREKLTTNNDPKIVAKELEDTIKKISKDIRNLVTTKKIQKIDLDIPKIDFPSKSNGKKSKKPIDLVP